MQTGKSKDKKKKKKQKQNPPAPPQKSELLDTLSQDAAKELKTNTIPIPKLAPENEANKFLHVLESISASAYAAELAAAITEAKLLNEITGGAPGEVDDVFDRLAFREAITKLLQIKTVQEMAKLIGIKDDIADQVLSSLVNSLFGSQLHKRGSKAFYGEDEDLLIHQARANLKGKAK